MQEIRVSSSWTLFYKFFIPTVWTVFFGVFTIFALVSKQVNALPYSLAVQGVMLLIFFGGLTFLWFTIMSFKRVEMAEDHFFVTNYFKTYRYTYESLQDVRENDLLVMRIVIFEFMQPSSFGKKIFFICRRQVWGDFVKRRPHLFRHLESADG